MSKELPPVILKYIKMSNEYNIQGYLETFSDDAIIKEDSLGKILVGKREIKHYLMTYFLNYQTHTEIIEYRILQNTVDMKVLFKGSFPGEEIVGLYKFSINSNGLIAVLEADLE